MRFAPLFFLPLLMGGCPGNVKPDPGNPLAVANCPESLPAVTDDTFGGTVTKAIEWAGIYHKCRKAAVGVANDQGK